MNKPAPSVQIKKIDTLGFDKTRYAVTFLGEYVGDVYSFTETTGRKSGGRTYYTSTYNVTRWSADGVDHKGARFSSSGETTRRDAIVYLLARAKHTHRDNAMTIASRLVRNSGL